MITNTAQFIRGDLVQDCCDHVFWSNAQPRINRSFQAGDVVFCKIDEVLHFFEKLRLTRKRVVLVTGEGDLPCDVFRQQFLPANVMKWFSINVTNPHSKVAAIPLGLGIPADHVTLDVASFAEVSKKNILRDRWLYVNFRPETNREVRQKIYDDFQQLSQREDWITCGASIAQHSNEEFMRQLLCHRFVLAPPGNGVDTHRLWEALAAGAYPIVLTSPAMEPFRALPILFVNSFEEVTLSFLKKQLKELEQKKENLFMLQLHFWKQQIEVAKANLQQQKMMSWREWLCESFCYGLKMIKRNLIDSIVK